MTASKLSFLSKCCLWQERLSARTFRIINTLGTGFWLGVLSQKQLDEITDYYYNKADGYYDPTYLDEGLYSWEKKAVEEHFKKDSLILIPGAGSGREVIGLHKLGYVAHGYDCNEKLIQFGNEKLQKLDHPIPIQKIEKNSVPLLDQQLDAAILGWGMYTHIPYRKQRIEFLSQIKAVLKPEAMLLLSFLDRAENIKRHKVIKMVANLFRTCFGRPKLELGDDTDTTYIHLFIESELREELETAGLEVIYYKSEPYPHALAQVKQG